MPILLPPSSLEPRADCFAIVEAVAPNANWRITALADGHYQIALEVDRAVVRREDHPTLPAAIMRLGALRADYPRIPR